MKETPPCPSILALIPVTPQRPGHGKCTRAKKNKKSPHRDCKDNGYHHWTNGFVYIKERLQQYCDYEISVGDITCYISTSKPRMFHIKELTHREVTLIRKVSVEDY